VWGNGATMDISLTEEAYKFGGYGLTVPWAFRNIRDMRTIVDAADHVCPGFQSCVPQVGTAHNALDDAKYQAMRIAECFAVIKGGDAAVEKILRMVSADSKCSVCGKPQFKTTSGVVCQNGHGGADPMDDEL
jgi:hypothetical protein